MEVNGIQGKLDVEGRSQKLKMFGRTSEVFGRTKAGQPEDLSPEFGRTFTKVRPNLPMFGRTSPIVRPNIALSSSCLFPGSAEPALCSAELAS